MAPTVSDPNAPASPEEILGLFGGNVAAAVNYLNTKGIEFEDGFIARTQQLQEAVNIIKAQDDWIMRAKALLEDPAAIANYVTELEWELGELPVIQEMKAKGITYEQGKQILSGMMQPQRQAQQMPDSSFNPNLTDPSQLAAQYTQQTMQRLGVQGLNNPRPSFPTIQPSGSASGQNLRDYPPHMWYKVIDQASRQGAFRGMALTF